MKHEWRKKEKAFYRPKAKPERIYIPAFKFFTIEGQGNPNGEGFAEYLAALYSLTYAIRMSPKKNMEPEGYYEYTVYPLEGIWDLTEKGRKTYDGQVDKDELLFKLMIRQPDFVNEAYAQKIMEYTQERKPHPLLEKVKFETLEEGDCVQMLHKGSFESESESFQVMEEFAAKEKLTRLSKTHREIYLKDPRRSPPEKLETVLRFWVEGQT